MAFHNPLMRSFSPRQLFGNGEKGAWYDPSDMSTLWQNSARTTAVTAVEQPVGCIDDKSGNGFHATQSNSASRPVLSARYNLITKSEQFDDAAWTKTRCTVTANDQTAPDGTTTGDKVNCNVTSAGGFYLNSSTATIPVGGEVLVVAYGKKGSRNQFLLSASSSGFGNGINVYFNLNNGSYVNSTSYGSGWSLVGTPDITSVDNGWYRMSFKVQTAATSLFVLVLQPSVTSSSDVSGTSGVDYGYVWGADIRVSNDGVGLPAYQRVNTSTDYDTSGFPMYLRFDGTDDSLATSSIDFSGTDAVTVWAGVRKLSDAARGTVVELTASAASNNGSFHLTAPNAASATYAFESKGTALTDAVVSSNVAAPITSVLCGYSDISSDQNILRVNGAQVDSDTSDQGTGNFSNAALYIGSRGGSSLRFNGRIYGLIARGASSTAGQISDTESWVNSRTRAY